MKTLIGFLEKIAPFTADLPAWLRYCLAVGLLLAAALLLRLLFARIFSPDKKEPASTEAGPWDSPSRADTLPFLDNYSGQSTEELMDLEGEFRTDSLVIAFEAGLMQKADRIGMEALSREERVVLAVEALEREVNNGGYRQFFLNSTNEYAPFVVDALNRAECTLVAELTREAIDSLGIPGEPTADKVEQAMEQDDADRDGKLDLCDERYYDEAGDLAGPLLAFIKANRDKIVLP